MNKFIYILFNKPYGVISQFTSQNESEKTLSDFNLPKDVYVAGRLDKDSEGLLFLTNDGQFNQKITNPKNELEKTYLVQVENIPTKEALKKLEDGVMIKKLKTKRAKARLLAGFDLPPRIPPIRERKNIPTAWLEIKIREGRNRQVRHMTAAIGHPTLRLIRASIGRYELKDLKSGEWAHVEKIT